MNQTEQNGYDGVLPCRNPKNVSVFEPLCIINRLFRQGIGITDAGAVSAKERLLHLFAVSVIIQFFRVLGGVV